MQVQLSKYVVELKDEMSWGDAEQIQAEIISSLRIDTDAKKEIQAKGDSFNMSKLQMDGPAMLRAKVLAAKLLITKITQVEGDKVVPFSQDWLFGLSVTDGVKLCIEVDAIRNKTDDTEGK